MPDAYIQVGGNLKAMPCWFYDLGVTVKFTERETDDWTAFSSQHWTYMSLKWESPKTTESKRSWLLVTIHFVILKSVTEILLIYTIEKNKDVLRPLYL